MLKYPSPIAAETGTPTRAMMAMTLTALFEPMKESLAHADLPDDDAGPAPQHSAVATHRVLGTTQSEGCIPVHLNPHRSVATRRRNDYENGRPRPALLGDGVMLPRSVMLLSALLLAFACSRPPAEPAAPSSPAASTERAAYGNAPPPASSEGTETRNTPVDRSTMELAGTEVIVCLPRSARAPMPGVVLLHSARGARPAILGYADDLAKKGFAVLALDFFDGRVPDTQQQANNLRDDANQRASEIGSLIEKAYQTLSTDERIRATRRYLVGWSYGAAWATSAASQLENLSGTVAYYGQNFTEVPSLYEQVECPLLLIGGLEDERPSPAKLREVEQGLKDHGKSVDLLLVKGGHGFAEPTVPSYEEASANEAWAATLAFLKR